MVQMLKVRMVRKKTTKPLTTTRLLKLDGILDDHQNRNEFVVSDASFARAVERASIKRRIALSLADTAILHGYEEKLGLTKKKLVQRMFDLAKSNMSGIQLDAFMLSFKFGVNKCVTSRSMKVSRQSIQIRNKRAIRRLKKLIYTDKQSIVLIAEMQQLRQRIAEMDVLC